MKKSFVKGRKKVDIHQNIKSIWQTQTHTHTKMTPKKTNQLRLKTFDNNRTANKVALNFATRFESKENENKAVCGNN